MKEIDNNTKDIEVNEAVRKYDENKRYTYADYELIDDGNRYELIDGVLYQMSAPSTAHQSILIELILQFAVFLKGKSCKVFAAPYDVCLNGLGDKDDNVVQPDLLVVCNQDIIDEKRCNGVPDLVVEILSPSTSRHDLFVKLKKYHNAKVREYWIVDPTSKSVNVHILENGHYVIHSYENNDAIKVHILPDCVISLPDVFSY